MRPQASASLLIVFLAFSSASWGQTSAAPVQPAADSSHASITVTVLDHARHPVSGLTAEQFRVLEDGQLKTISSVATQDDPVCIGFVVDKSGSMRGKLGPIANALRSFLDASNPQNHSFVMTFNDDRSLAQDFTSNAALIEKAVATAEPRGGTSLYDAIVASSDYLAETGGCDRRALVIVSDGDDNESLHTLKSTISALQKDGNPILYPLAWLDTHRSFRSRGQKVVEVLAASTGGVEFFAKNLDDLRKIGPELADVIRHQYAVSYVASAPATAGTGKIAVELNERHKDWLVRTNVAPRSGVLPVSQPLAH